MSEKQPITIKIDEYFGWALMGLACLMIAILGGIALIVMAAR